MLADTCLSAVSWLRDNYWETPAKVEKKIEPEYAIEKIELANLVF